MDRRYAGGNGGSHAGIGVGGAAAAASNRPYSVTRHVRAADHIAQVDSELLFLSADEDVSLDDAVRCAKIAQQAGCSVDLVVWPRVWCAPTTSFHSGSSISCRGW